MQRGVRRSLIDAESMLELFQRKPTVQDGPNDFVFKSGNIDFHNLGFSYDNKKDTISDFNFHASSGQKIALVGETGGGKSTILKLLFRFYDVQRGAILIDNQDIKSVTLQSVRQCIGVVPQDPVLFNDSVMENVRYSKLGASDDEVIEACKGASIHDKILTFSEGYQTRVGENGVRLSGGELQRLAIARVILKNPEIVLLDEATSSVDTETEAKIQEALDKLAKGRTTVTIAHRLSTVTSSDIIVVIKGGAIVEQGSPQALMKAKGKFSELWLKQIGINPTPTDDLLVEEKPTCSSELPDSKGKGASTRLSGDSASSGKSLRPTAPEFVPQKNVVPRCQRGTKTVGDESGNDGHPLKTKDLDGSSDIEPKDCKSKGKSGLQVDQSKGDVALTTQADASDPKRGTTGPPKSKKKRLNPAQRRRNNKTDPSSSASKPGPRDELSNGLTSSGCANPSVPENQSRRVSAPPGPLESITNTLLSGRAQRRHAQQERSQKGQYLESAPTNPSGEGSGTITSNNRQLPVPPITIRLPGSIQETTPKESNGANSSGVHFPPDI